MNRRLKAKMRSGGGLTTRLQAQIAVDKKGSDPTYVSGLGKVGTGNEFEKANNQSFANLRSNVHGLSSSGAAKFPIHREGCPHYNWELREASLITKGELKEELMDKWMEWSKPEEEAEVKKKCEQALRKSGPIGWYMRSQKQTVKQYKEESLKGVACTCNEKETKKSEFL